MVPSISGKFTHPHSPLRKRICRIIDLDCQLQIEKGKLVMSLYDSRQFPLQGTKNPHLDSNVPCMPMYGVHISQLLRFAGACDRHSDFPACHKCQVRTLHDQDFRYGLLCRKFTGPTIPWSSVIPTLWCSISRRVSIVRFSDDTFASCWLPQWQLALKNYQSFSPHKRFSSEDVVSLVM